MAREKAIGEMNARELARYIDELEVQYRKRLRHLRALLRVLEDDVTDDKDLDT